MSYPDKAATQQAKQDMLKLNYNEDIGPGIEYIKSFEQSSPFADKLTERAIHLGYSGNPKNAEDLREFLLSFLCSEPGIINDENIRTWKNNLRNWLFPHKDAPAPMIPKKREIVYQLCFALRMNMSEAGEFFVKGYLEEPFNFKVLRESVYCYCLNNGLRYLDAAELYLKAQSIPSNDAFAPETDTATIGRMVSESHDEQAFLSYIRLNRSSFETHATTAQTMVLQIINECLPYATDDCNLHNSTEYQDAIGKRDDRVENDNGTNPNINFQIKKVEQVSISNAESLMSVIYGYYARDVHQYDGKKKSSIAASLSKDSLFPRLIRERMVCNAMHLSQIRNAKAPNWLLRSALILFNFYHFFMQAKKADCTNARALFEEFVDEMDSKLLACGFGQLYWRNPYDWMIGYCALAPDPVDELRYLIDVFFLDAISDDPEYTLPKLT